MGGVPRECKSQGLANIITGFIGGMAGCAMIGQSVINVKSGGRGRLSTLVAGVLLLLMVVFSSHWVFRIPMAALVSVMIMVSISTFSWQSIMDLRRHPFSSNIVMLSTVIVVVATHNLAYGVFTGVLFAAVFFMYKVGQFIEVCSELDPENNCRTYRVKGQVFFASADLFLKSFHFKESIAHVIIDISHAHIWDITSVSILDKIILKFRQEGALVKLTGANEETAALINKFAISQ